MDQFLTLQHIYIHTYRRGRTDAGSSQVPTWPLFMLSNLDTIVFLARQTRTDLLLVPVLTVIVPVLAVVPFARKMTSASLRLSGSISHDIAMLLLPYIACYLLIALPKRAALSWYFHLHRHSCAIPHFVTYCAIVALHPIKTCTKELHDTVTTKIERYEKHRCQHRSFCKSHLHYVM